MRGSSQPPSTLSCAHNFAAIKKRNPLSAGVQLLPSGSRQAESQLACKPGSVPRIAPPRWPFIWDARCRAPQATNPDGDAETHCAPQPEPQGSAVPIRFCSRRGLPCQPCCQRCGALLPHPFTLTSANAGGLLSVALSLGLPLPDVIRRRVSVEPGLSSARDRLRAAAIRPTGWSD